MHKMWVFVDSDYPYQSNKDFGANDNIELIINTGTSSKDTRTAGKIKIYRNTDGSIDIQTEIL